MKRSTHTYKYIDCKIYSLRRLMRQSKIPFFPYIASCMVLWWWSAIIEVERKGPETGGCGVSWSKRIEKWINKLSKWETLYPVREIPRQWNCSNIFKGERFLSISICIGRWGLCPIILSPPMELRKSIDDWISFQILTFQPQVQNWGLVI